MDEKVPKDEALTWFSPTVVQPKPRCAMKECDKIESHMICASIDMRILDQYIKSSRYDQAAIIEDFM